MKRLFEFECNAGHRFEALTKYSEKQVACKHCENVALRVISTPRINLEGWSMSFPTAADKWARNHYEAHRVARKRAVENGDA